jgi:hypothetical protein
MIIMNAATSIITTKSNYIARVLNDLAAGVRADGELGAKEQDQEAW